MARTATKPAATDTNTGATEATFDASVFVERYNAGDRKAKLAVRSDLDRIMKAGLSSGDFATAQQALAVLQSLAPLAADSARATVDHELAVACRIMSLHHAAANLLDHNFTPTLPEADVTLNHDRIRDLVNAGFEALADQDRANVISAATKMALAKVSGTGAVRSLSEAFIVGVYVTTQGDPNKVATVQDITKEASRYMGGPVSAGSINARLFRDKGFDPRGELSAHIMPVSMGDVMPDGRHYAGSRGARWVGGDDVPTFVTDHINGDND